METKAEPSEEEVFPVVSNVSDLTIDVYRPLKTAKDAEYEGKAIKSFAIDMHSIVPNHPKLLLLQNNTDLNTPPPNWLSRTKKSIAPYLGNPRVGIFTSFNMASSFLDSIGEVDVVCEALVIKKLLKIPYSCQHNGSSCGKHFTTRRV
jgi:hypothetical protein